MFRELVMTDPGNGSTTGVAVRTGALDGPMVHKSATAIATSSEGHLGLYDQAGAMIAVYAAGHWLGAAMIYDDEQEPS